jgi:transposase InsO family protein
MDGSKPIRLSPEALFRYQLVSAVRVRTLAGVPAARAVSEVATLVHTGGRTVSERSLYRWLRAYEEHGPSALETRARPRTQDSLVLSREFIAFLKAHKDRETSLPEIIRQARLTGVVGPRQNIDRATVWRTARRLGLPLTRSRRLKHRDMRRYGYPNRMLMTLADGKHFKVGVKRRRRVALVFLDDATRHGLDLLVGTDENQELFLHGLHGVLRRYGLMSALFVDRGPGFIAKDSHTVAARLRIHLIHGSRAYPEGHGKIERFNRTFKSSVLRRFDGCPGIDSDPSALRLRLLHWLREDYNHRPHEGLALETPAQRWERDPRALSFPSDSDWLKQAFTIDFERSVSKDNVLSYDGTSYEVPRGHGSDRIVVTRHLLEADALSILHEGQQVRLHPVDPAANAYSRRARPTADEPSLSSTPGSAELRFAADFRPLVDSDGGYPGGSDDDDHDDD